MSKLVTWDNGQFLNSLIPTKQKKCKNAGKTNKNNICRSFNERCLKGMLLPIHTQVNECNEKKKLKIITLLFIYKKNYKILWDFLLWDIYLQVNLENYKFYVVCI